MRAIYNYLATGIERDPNWFRPLSEEREIPQVDWENNNNDDSVSDELSEDLSDVEDMEIGTIDDNDDDVDDGDDGGEDDSQNLDEVNMRDNGTLSALQKSVFNLLYKVESRFEHDSVTYK